MFYQMFLSPQVKLNLSCGALPHMKTRNSPRYSSTDCRPHLARSGGSDSPQNSSQISTNALSRSNINTMRLKMPVSLTPIPLRPPLPIVKRCTGNEVDIYQKTCWCFKQCKAQLEILFYNIHYQRVKQVLLNFDQHTIFTVISIKKHLERYIQVILSSS